MASSPVSMSSAGSRGSALGFRAGAGSRPALVPSGADCLLRCPLQSDMASGEPSRKSRRRQQRAQTAGGRVASPHLRVQRRSRDRLHQLVAAGVQRADPVQQGGARGVGGARTASRGLGEP